MFIEQLCYSIVAYNQRKDIFKDQDIEIYRQVEVLNANICSLIWKLICPHYSLIMS